ncbi:MAG: UDP-N-acetylmuramate:L-alanyl-gamma-D-glutamyl-meso-diaminopimelate ligase [Proteobacteria bacterium]|nr:UDP-N-acetylmuramate:L-alanyl-gamma-D-glutamyl-meso-diaminopimelate ligase [Pseudomonadota bacterium]
MPLIERLPEGLKTIHIIGIAGTAMGALAGMLKDAGYTVTGSDTGCYPPMSTYLEGLGIEVMIGFNASNLDHKPDLVVVGNVVREIYDEAQALLASDIPYCSLPQILGHQYLDKARSVVVSGTHGKTTTTSITAWLLEAGGLEPGFLIGGVAKNFDRTARAGAGSHFVIEGDEYDTAFFDKRPKFLHYRPNTAILTSVEFDHADIYTDLDHVKRSFRELMGILPEDGLLIVRGDDPGADDVAAEATCEVWRYGKGEEWDGRIDSVDTNRGVMQFTVTRGGQPVGTFESSLVGEHNLYNQVAACAAAVHQGLDAEALAKGFASFQGIRRRQELRGTPGNVAIIDDFAHHPTAVHLTLGALRQRFGERRLWAVWEPRSATSRRRVFQDAYARAFDDADLVIIGAPYDQSRIDASERFSADELVQALTARGVDAMTLEDADQIAATLNERAHPHDVIAVLSNGAFGGLHNKLLDGLTERFGAGVTD